MVDFKKLFREIHEEPGTGILSWGRCASSIALFACIGWVSYLLHKNAALPGLVDVTGFVLGPYGANKVTTAISNFSGQGK